MTNFMRNVPVAAGLLGVAVLAAAGLLLIAETPAHADCDISGPATAGVNQSFSLCGPSVSGSTYEWSGPGIQSGTNSRCIAVDGLAQGGYEFLLIRRVRGAEVERCRTVVNVGSSTGGVESCSITGPETIAEGASATLCAPQDGLHSYTWTSPSGATSTAGCITAREEGTYTLQSRNRVTGSSRTCSHLLTVTGYSGGGGSGSDGDCDIIGPATIGDGTTAQLCAPSHANASYRWTGPNGFVGTTSCINVDEPGTYSLTMRNFSTGRTVECSQVLAATNSRPGNGGCDIVGPTTIPRGSSVQLCAPSYFAATSLRWSGPRGFSSTSRCITVRDPGNYTLTVRNLSTGRTTTCTQAMDWDDYSDPDQPISTNCPRDLQYWRTAIRSYGSPDLSRTELNALARTVDNRSAYFNWSNDVTGLQTALSPTQPLTRRKQVIREFAALLSNVAAGEINLATDGGDNIGLDMDTPVNYGGAHTIGELIALTDRLLTGNRGDFAKLNATLNQINRGRGIGPTCN